MVERSENASSASDLATEPPQRDPVGGDGDGDQHAAWTTRLLRPAPMVAAATVLSFTAWAIGNQLKEDAIDFTANPVWGSLVYLCWIAAAVAAAHVGFSIAGSTDVAPGTPVPSARALHTGLLVTAGVGIVYIIGLWYRDGLDVIGLIADNQANELRYAIPFSAGPATLRYAAIPAAALAMRNALLYRWHADPGRLRSVDVLSLVCLAVVAVPSSRLSVLMALVSALTVLGYVDNRAPSMKKVVAVIVLMAVVLSALNYSRNGGYYRERGVSDPASMLLYQSVSYLGAAFEGGSVTGEVLLGRTAASPEIGLEHVASPLIPTFFPWVDPEPPGSISIHEISTIDPSLTTNSWFASATLDFGVAAMVSSLLAIFGAAVLTAMLLRRRTLAPVLAAGPLLYGFAEVWRLNIFNDGLLVFCVVWPLLLHELIELARRRRPT